MKKKQYVSLCLSALILTSAGCSKSKIDETAPPTVVVPGTVAVATVTTMAVSTISTSSVVAGGMIVNSGGAPVTSRGVCLSKIAGPTVSDNKSEATSVKGSGEFTSNFTGLEASTKYFVRAYAVNSGGTSYGAELEFQTSDIVSARMSIDPMYIIGSTLATCDVEVTSDGGAAVTERGICWSTSVNPTITSSKSVHGSGRGRFRGSIKGLTEKTTYHLRAYAINTIGVNYSDDYTFKTIPAGHMTYTFNKATAPTTVQLAAYARMQIAVDSAMWYLNNYTSATKHIYLNYDAGVPTADANNEGWMRFGSNESYQNLRTMLHELNHTMGSGTTSYWTGTLVIGGVYRGTNANAMLRLITKDPAAEIHGDTQHFWPYGLNQNSEVTSSWDYVYNCLIAEAMRKDGLPAAGVFVPY